MESFQERLQMAAVQMIPFLMAIVFHEVAHAYVARKHGDDTAEQLGRLTLNPVPHLDPIGTIAFPLINMLTGWNLLFGWAKPVPINYNRIKPYRRGLFMVSLAGPGINFIMGFLAALFYVVITITVPSSFYLFEPLQAMSIAAISINYALAIFNLIPLPPLDGSKMVEAFLSFESARKFEKLGNYSFFILLALLWSGALNVLSVPISFLSHVSVSVWTMFLSAVGVLS